VIVGIDPGYLKSAWIAIDGDGIPTEFDIVPNETLIAGLRLYRNMVSKAPLAIVIEQIQSYGMAVGAEVFETVFWSGQFAEAARPVPVHRMPRRLVKLHLCGDSRAKDANIRQALIDLYGGSSAKGIKKAPGPLYGVSKDVWSALAVARTFYDGQIRYAR
jgi:hypothetical protein